VSQDAASTATDGSLTASRDGAILRLTLDRPSRRNSLNRKMIEEFVATLTEAATDDSLRAIHVRGAGDDFCSGADWVATNSGSDQRPRTGAIRSSALSVDSLSVSVAVWHWPPTSRWRPTTQFFGSLSRREGSVLIRAQRGYFPD
jgi:1,4-dihydroxy-2-naphthoyl-CoA synthase